MALFGKVSSQSVKPEKDKFMNSKRRVSSIVKNNSGTDSVTSVIFIIYAIVQYLDLNTELPFLVLFTFETRK